MQVERIPTLGDNYSYLIIDEATREAAVVDAPEVAPVVRRVEKLGVRVTRILSTHHHPDHAGANPELARLFDAPVLGHVSDADRIPGFTTGLEEGDPVEIGSLRATVIFVPAHTRGHIAYSLPGAVFCGDTLFAGGCGRLFEGDAAMMHEALNRKLAALPENTRVYCGHEYTESNLLFALSVEGNNPALHARMEDVRARRARAVPDWHEAGPDEFTIPSTIAEEKATNPFMRVRVPELIETVCRANPRAPTDPISVLGALRAMKDSF